MELIKKCEICGKRIDTKFINKDYLVITHYFEGNIKRFYICNNCLKDVLDDVNYLMKKRKEEYYIKHPEYKYFNYLGVSRDKGVMFFALKDKLDKQTWDKISHCFFFCSYSSENDKIDPPDSARGRWVTTRPLEVLKILGWK